jgi:hypothetical protein
VNFLIASPTKTYLKNHISHQRMRLATVALLSVFMVIFVACNPVNLITGNVVQECEALSTPSLRDTCYAELGVLRLNLDLCDEAENKQIKYYCYTEIANLTSSPGLCKEIDDSYWQPICYRDVGMSLDDKTLCSKVANDKLSDDCYMDVAEATLDADACLQVNATPRAIACVTKIAVEEKDAKICTTNFRKGHLSYDRCIMEVAIAQPDPATCNHMAYESTREICLDRAKMAADAARNQPSN